MSLHYSKTQHRDATVKLLEWYKDNARTLPWRATLSKRVSPYEIWLSEIMLQQTTVATVIPYFERFTQAWPTLNTLAQANIDDILAKLAGLGYYARARNLHLCAQILITKHQGQFPKTVPELLALPGIGPYTAGALASLIYGLPYPAIDGNAERVFTRFFAIETPLPKAKKTIHTQAETLLPPNNSPAFNQAIMELGARICRPKNPLCAQCPLQNECRGYKEGTALNFPIKPQRKKSPTHHGDIFILQNEKGEFWMQPRPKKGLLGGMWEFPASPWPTPTPNKIQANPLQYAPCEGNWLKHNTSITHIFTHFRLELRIWQASLPHANSIQNQPRGFWVNPIDFPKHPIPTLMLKIAKVVASTSPCE